jgi:hypothetical protein
MPTTITAAWIIAGDPFREDWIGQQSPLPEPAEWVRLVEIQRGGEIVTVDVASTPQLMSAAVRFTGTISGTARDLVGQVGYFLNPCDAARLPLFSNALHEWSPVLRRWCYQEIATADAVSKLLGILPGIAVVPSSDDQSVGDAVWLPLPTPRESSRRVWLVGIGAAAIGGALGFVFGTRENSSQPPQDAEATQGAQPTPKGSPLPQATPVPRVTPSAVTPAN